MAPPALSLDCASVAIPQHGKERNPKGEDAHFYQSNCVGVFDGVGGWASEGVNPRRYAQGMMQYTQSAIAEKEYSDPKELLWEAFRRNKEEGSCTACVATLQSVFLQVAWLGDSGAMLLRDGVIHRRFQPQQHKFNQPYQLCHKENSDSPDDVGLWDVVVLEGDILIMGTDGLFDNLIESQILLASQNYFRRVKGSIMKVLLKNPEIRNLINEQRLSNAMKTFF